MIFSAIESVIQEKKNIYLYGAGIVACGALKAIRLIFDAPICALLVTSAKDNPQNVLGVPVIELEHLNDSDAFIIITAPEQYHLEIAKNLENHHLLQYAFLDSDAEYALMREYLKRCYHLQMVDELVENLEAETKLSNDDVFIGMATSVFDKNLRGEYKEPEWVKKVQAGAALTTQSIAPFSDAQGDSISKENPIYGELTATYYIWKNEQSRIKGLYHYRRVLDVDEHSLKLLDQGIVDVILPIPYVCEHVTRDQFGRYLSDEDIQIMLDVLKEKYPGVYPKIQSVLDAECIYNYNILVARAEVYDDYCNWMFPLLKEMDLRGSKVTTFRMTRHIGRIGEVLTSIYFSLNEKNWKIAHTKKIWRA